MEGKVEYNEVQASGVTPQQAPPTSDDLGPTGDRLTPSSAAGPSGDEEVDLVLEQVRRSDRKNLVEILRQHGYLDLSESKRKTLKVLLKHPGMSIKEVAEALDVTHTTAGRHLRSLCSKGLVTREKEGCMERHYAISTREPRSLSWLRVTIQDSQRYAIVEYLVLNHKKETTVNKIANDVNVYHGLLLRTLRALEKHELVELVRPGGWYYVKIRPELLQYWERFHAGK